MANEDYKNGKLVEIVREFNHIKGTTRYEINGIVQSIAVPFWRDEEGKFKVVPKGSYKFISESGNNYLEITDETILQQAFQFQIVYVYSQISSKYVEDFPELSVLTTKYNELVDDATKLFSYLKSVGMISDTFQMTKVLSPLEPMTTWYMDEKREIKALPISELYVKFNLMIEKLKKILADYTESKKEEIRGATFFPHLMEDGTLSWTNDKNKPNPEPVNIKGPAGTIENVTASVNSNAGTPSVKVTMSGTKENRSFNLEFQNLKGDKPIKGTDYYTQQEKEQFTTEMVGIVKTEGNKVVEQVKNIVAGNPATTNALTLSGKTRSEFEQDVENVKVDLNKLIYLNLNLKDGYYDSSGNILPQIPTNLEKYTEQFFVSPNCDIYTEINLEEAKSGWWAICYWDSNNKFLKREQLTFTFGTHAEAKIKSIDNAVKASITFRSYGNAKISVKINNGNTSQNIIKLSVSTNDVTKKVNDLNDKIRDLNLKDKEYLESVIGKIDVKYNVRGTGTIKYNNGLEFIFTPSSDYTNWWFYNSYDTKYGFVDISDETKAIVIKTSQLFETTLQVKIRGYNAEHSQYKELIKNIYPYDNRKIILKWSDLVKSFTAEYSNIWIEGLNCITWKESDFGKTVIVNVGIYDTNILEKIKPISSKEFHIVAHRGSEKDAPENTIIAFEKAYNKGYRYLETDIQFTSDGIPVLFHDETIDTKSNGSGTIASHTLDELKALDFGSWKSPEFLGTKICTLEEFLIFCKKRNCFLYLEIKNSYPPTFTIQQAKIVSDMVDSYNMSKKVTWIGFSCEGLKLLRQCNSVYRLGIVKKGVTSATILTELDSLINGNNNVFVDLSILDLSDEICKAILNKGYDIETWTLSSKDDADKIIKYINGFTLSD